MQDEMMAAEFDFDDFLKQAKMVSNMGSLAGIAKMMPGMMGKIDQSQLKMAEVRLKKNEAMICSMTKQERHRPELLIAHPSARSHLQRIAKGSGMKIDGARGSVSEIQKMRMMMSRMSKMMSGGGGPGGMDPAMTGADGAEMGMPGNCSARGSSKKKKKGGKGFGGGFG
jgi:signal recognition particle subunit SRP54